MPKALPEGARRCVAVLQRRTLVLADRTALPSNQIWDLSNFAELDRISGHDIPAPRGGRWRRSSFHNDAVEPHPFIRRRRFRQRQSGRGGGPCLPNLLAA